MLGIGGESAERQIKEKIHLYNDGLLQKCGQPPEGPEWLWLLLIQMDECSYRKQDNGKKLPDWSFVSSCPRERGRPHADGCLGQDMCLLSRGECHKVLCAWCSKFKKQTNKPNKASTQWNSIQAQTGSKSQNCVKSVSSQACLQPLRGCS